jgi:hypothetical protein
MQTTNNALSEYESDTGYVGFYECHPCAVCSEPVDGVGVFATGKTIKHVRGNGDPIYEYTPRENELLKNIWMVCGACGWDQYS